jgi:magnesium transporter
MHRVLKKRSTKAGLPPGAMVHVGERKAERVGLSLIEFGPEHYERKDLRRIEDAFPLKPGPVVTWLSVDGLHETAVLEHIGRQFGIHPLILEDILNTDQRPKIEVYDDYIFVVLKTITVQGAADRLDIEQVSLLLGPNYVITFQERAADVFDPVRERIRTNKGRIAKSGPDYLMYALLDMIIDNYFLVLERLGERIDLLEERVIARPDSHSVQDIQILKREMIFLRRSVWPLREVIGRLIREESALVQDATSPYLHDLYDHTVQVADTVS